MHNSNKTFKLILTLKYSISNAHHVPVKFLFLWKADYAVTTLLSLLAVSAGLRIFFKPIPVNPLIIERIGESKLKKQNGKNDKVGTPKVLAAKAPATPQGIK